MTLLFYISANLAVGPLFLPTYGRPAPTLLSIVFPKTCEGGKGILSVVSGEIPRFTLGSNARLLIFANCWGVKLSDLWGLESL